VRARRARSAFATTTRRAEITLSTHLIISDRGVAATQLLAFTKR